MGNGEKGSTGDRVQSWIRTLWPMLLTLAVAIMAYTSLETRVQVLERSVCDMQNSIEELQDGQASTNVALGVINTNITTLNANVERIVRILDSNQ